MPLWALTQCKQEGARPTTFAYYAYVISLMSGLNLLQEMIFLRGSAKPDEIVHYMVMTRRKVACPASLYPICVRRTRGRLTGQSRRKAAVYISLDASNA